MRLLGIMELQLARGFLPLLLLTCLSAGTVNQTADPVITMQCEFEILLKNLTVRERCCESEGLKVPNQTNPAAPRENCTNLISPCVSAAHVGICEFRVFITRTNSTGTGNSTEEAVLTYCLVGLQTNVTDIWTGLNLLCIFFGLAMGTLIYTPILGFLLWQCRRNRTGKPTNSEVVEGNQLNMAASVTGTEDLTYANLKFEEKGTKPASSNIIYTEIKPSQQKHSGGNDSAASTEVEVYPKKEGK